MESSTPIVESNDSPENQEDDDHLFTPVLYTSLSRKRKIMATARRLQCMTLHEPEPSPVPYYMSPDVQNVLTTSTTGDSVNFSRCVTFNSNTSSLYTSKHIPEENLLKRQRLCTTSTISKSQSAPSTPTREMFGNSNFNKSLSYHFTPSKKYHAKKIETPEKFKILYPHLKQVKTPSKPKTPQKFREMIQTSKKSLFCRDPFEYFCVLSKHDEIVHKIFSYLPAEELLKVQTVSHLWRRLVGEDKKSKERCLEYLDSVQKEKENRVESLCCPESANTKVETVSPPPSPNSVNHVRYKKAAEKLTTLQELTKCLECLHPAVKQGFICQCVNSNCGYIWCRNCLSSSFSGPKNFTDNCATAELSVTPLSDLSNMDCTPSFLIGGGASSGVNKSAGTLDSSGYMSMSEVNMSGKMQVLHAHNNTFTKVRRATLDVKPVSSVRLLTPKIGKQGREGSTSPKPKMHTVGSLASRKNLRRLY